MSEIKLIEPYKSMWGKPFRKSTWWTFRRGLFIRREMARLKAEGNLAADPTQNLQDWSHAHATPMCDAYN